MKFEWMDTSENERVKGIGLSLPTREILTRLENFYSYSLIHEVFQWIKDDFLKSNLAL